MSSNKRKTMDSRALTTLLAEADHAMRGKRSSNRIPEPALGYLTLTTLDPKVLALVTFCCQNAACSELFFQSQYDSKNMPNSLVRTIFDALQSTCARDKRNNGGVFGQMITTHRLMVIVVHTRVSQSSWPRYLAARLC